MLNLHCNTFLTPTSFLERSGCVYPNKIALECDGFSISYSELLTRCRRLAAVLRDLGVNYGDRIGVLSHNSHHMIEAHFSIPGAGGVIVSLNPWLSDEVLLRQIEFCGCHVLLTQESLLNRFKTLFNHLESTGKYSVVVMDAAKSSGLDCVINFEYIQDHYEGDNPLDEYLLSEQDPIALNFTSGTTGEPKGVLYSHRAAYLHAIGQVLMLELTAKSHYYWSLPMFHVNGWGHMWATIAVGCVQHIASNANGLELNHLETRIKKFPISHLAGAPRLIKSLNCLKLPISQLSGLTVLTGGAAPSPELVLNMMNKSIRLIHQYGLNETCGPFVVCEPQDDWHLLSQKQQVEKQLRQGVAAIHSAGGVRVVDVDQNDVPRDGKTLGEVLMRGNTVAIGYYNNPKATEDSFQDGWFHSGDLAVVFPDGYIEIKDRKKDLVFVNTDYGWENVSSIEIEHIISEFPHVLDVSVISIPLGEEDSVLVACLEVIFNDSFDFGALREFCLAKLPEYKVPEFFLTTELPKTATGKVKKHELTDWVRTKLKVEPQSSGTVERALI